LKDIQDLMLFFSKQVENKLPFVEGGSINKQPMFGGVNYQFWKVRMFFLIH